MLPGPASLSFLGRHESHVGWSSSNPVAVSGVCNLTLLDQINITIIQTARAMWDISWALYLNKHHSDGSRFDIARTCYLVHQHSIVDRPYAEGAGVPERNQGILEFVPSSSITSVLVVKEATKHSGAHFSSLHRANC